MYNYCFPEADKFPLLSPKTFILFGLLFWNEII